MKEQLLNELNKVVPKPPKSLLIGKVLSVDTEGKTMQVEPLDSQEPELTARLNGSFGNEQYVVPKTNSIVLVGMINNHEGILLGASEIDSFRMAIDNKSIELSNESLVFNGGSKGGLIEINKLSREIEKLNSNFEMLAQAISIAPVALGDGGSSFKSALVAALQFQKADVSSTENEEVKQ